MRKMCQLSHFVTYGIEASVTWIEGRFLLALLRRAPRTLNMRTLLRRATRTSKTLGVIVFSAGYFLSLVILY